MSESRRHAALIGLLLASTIAAAAESAPSYAYGLPIRVSTPAASQVLSLPAAVYEQAQHPGPSDIAVLDADGRAVPHALCAPAEPARGAERFVPLPLYPLQTPATPAASSAGTATLSQSSDGTTISRTITLQPLPAASETEPRIGAYLLDLRELPAGAIALLVDWQRADGGSELDLELARSGDLQDWSPLAQTRLLQAEAGGRALAARRIAFTAEQRDYLRIASRVPLSQLELQAVLPAVADAPVLRWFVAQAGALTRPDGAVRIDYRSQPSTPVQAARLRLPTGVQTLDLQLRALGADGQPLGPLWSGIVRPDSTQDELPHWAPQASAGLRIDILRGGQALAEPLPLELGYRPARLTFATQGPGPWQLVYGAARPPTAERWQCSELIEGAATADVVGKPRTLAGEAALKAPDAPLPLRQWTLWTLLLIGAAAVIGMAWQTLRERR